MRCGMHLPRRRTLVMTPGDGAGMDARLAESARRAEAALALTAACVAEQRGLGALERVREGV